MIINGRHCRNRQFPSESITTLSPNTICAKYLNLNSDLFKGNITFDIHDSVVTMSIRYHFFKEIFDAFLNGAIIIKYHGYELLPDIENLTLTDHRDSLSGKDRVFTLVKFPAKFDFQVK